MDFNAPMWVLLINAVIALCYTIARIYLLVEAFVGLRLLPDATFDCVD